LAAASALWGCGSTAAHESADSGSPEGTSSSGGSGGADTNDGGGVPGSSDATSGGGADGSNGGSSGGGTGGSDASVADGSTADSGTATVDGGARCKRGIASNMAPSAAFVPTASSPGIVWWYNWSNQGSSGSTGIEFDPMIWGSGSLNATIPAGSRFLLGFNEPNFKSQSDLTDQQAAADWPMVEAKANGIPLVSPAVNFCGSSSDSSGCTDPNVTDPYTYLKDFFADCSGCEVDYIAVHWYNCDLPSLRAYIDGNEDAGGTLQGFTQFKKPIWLTEFSCDTTHSVADQQAYMEAAVPYLESNPNVFRYSWFSASGIPNAVLMNSDGSLTALGTTYVGLAEACR
jgi:hypothetical protein